MTLFVLEGLSKSGKSTIRDVILKQRPRWVMWKGENLMRKGVDKNWVNYMERYHEALHRLYELNGQSVIIADRGFSEPIYNSDPQLREEFLRLVACYGDAHVLYFEPGDSREHPAEVKDRLKERGTRDEHRLEDLQQRYQTLLQMFKSQRFDTHEMDVPQTVAAVEGYILEAMDDTDHNPDV